MNDQTQLDADDLLELTAHIVSAYVSNNKVAADGLASLISSVDAALKGLSGAAPAPAPVELVPAVPVKKSISPDYIICLEDGKKFKSLKRHLRTVYNLSPDEYRAKWGLPPTYPMVSPNYASARSALAKASGLGQQRRTPAPVKGKMAAKTGAKPGRKPKG